MRIRADPDPKHCLNLTFFTSIFSYICMCGSGIQIQNESGSTTLKISLKFSFEIDNKTLYPDPTSMYLDPQH